MAVSMTEVTHREQNYFSLLPSVHSKKKKKEEAAPKMNVVSILLLRRLQKPGSVLCYSTRSLERSVTLLPSARMRKQDRPLTGTSHLGVWEDYTMQKVQALLSKRQHLPQTRWIQLKFVQVQLRSFLALKGTDRQLT